jgi:hypothetical protein
MYRTRPGEEESIVLVGRVENSPDIGEIIHIQIQGLSLRNPYTPTGTQSTLGHTALTAEAMRHSVIRRVSGDLDAPAFDEGYRSWQSVFESGEAQVFMISVSEIVDVLQEALDE